MLIRCPGAKYLGKTEVKGYKLLYRGNASTFGVATIEPADGESVPAGLWRITAADERALDRYEGYPFLYEKEMVTVELNGIRERAMVYVMRPGHELAAPSMAYFNTIWRGYMHCGLDESYLFKATAAAFQNK